MDPRGASRAAAFAAVSLAAALTLALWQRRLSRRRSTRKKASNSSREGQELPEWIANAAAAMPCLDAPGGGRELDKQAVHDLRRELFCPGQSVSYANSDPLMVVRGRGSKLFDEAGNAFLDTRNNVGHLGHSHPAVVAAVARQAAAINTNTRYLHPNHVRLAAKLLEKCPAPLDRVFFVNSGSEANDLALRLARAATGKKDVIVVEHAYHGHTSEVCLRGGVVSLIVGRGLLHPPPPRAAAAAAAAVLTRWWCGRGATD